VTRPSRGGEVLLISFGLVFAAAGLFFAGSLLFGAPGQVQGNSWVGVLVSTIFIFVGGGLIFATIYGTRKLNEQAAAEQANPGSPWLWRKDWAARRAESRNRNSAIGLWAAAIFANGMAFTVAAAIAPRLWRTSNPAVFFPLVFCVVGVIVALAAIRASIRRKRFGRTYFEFASLPFSPGGSLKGAIHLHFGTDARHGVDLSLSCIRQVTIGNGKDRSVQETVLWQADKNVPPAFLTPGPMGDATIPVDFSIPSDAYESYFDQPDDKVLWLLHAQADVPGVNYSDDFEVPVFRLASSPSSSSVSSASFSQPQSGIAPPAFESDASDVAAPPNPKVVVSAGTNGGTEFHFPAFRNPGQFLVLLAVTAVWTAIVYFLIHDQHAPRFFGLVFGFFDVILIYALIRAATGSSRIEVGDGRIRFRRSILGIGNVREVPFSDIAQILTVTIAQQRNARASYYLYLYTKDGKKLTLADAIDNRQEAQWVAAQLEKLAGLKLDTHVAVQSGLGMPGAPPQRGRAPSRPSSAFRRNSPVATAVGLAFFLAWMGFIGYHIFSQVRRQPNRVSRRGASAKRPLRQVAYSPLTEMDVQRLQSLPEQARAEELLERAIQHDARALDLFEQNIGAYRNLTRTTQMNELEDRSRYSTDLRVRYANADLNLALDGLPKTHSSADQLIALAQADPEHRPYSVYHMGMLAGRGVDYDRIYPILMDYAKNDADPQVRQWAVEGMRYLGSDEALDQLFDSFIHDPSDAVRDRAGCNISDCGNFTRKQRMRMTPRLIELAADSETTAKIRNCAFVALREITDQTLPADISVWRKWYAQHGAEKMAEFEQLDWWKVRGDQ
jgi:HEAT repeats